MTRSRRIGGPAALALVPIVSATLPSPSRAAREASAGPKVEVELDAARVKESEAAR